MADSETQLNSDLISQSLNYHGQLLQKTWESEKGEEFQKLGIENVEFSVYQQRQKHLSFQDRGKRLKLQQFIVKKSNVLFDTNLFQMEETRSRPADSGHFALLPPFEYFLSLDKSSRLQHLFQSLKVGDVTISNITSKANAGLILKVMCVEGENVHSVGDLNVKAFCPTSNLIPAVDKKNLTRSFMMNDLVCCEVLEVVPDAEKIICGMKGVYASVHRARLGLFHSEDFPESYKLAQETRTDNYEGMLNKSVGFHNPSNINCLSNSLGLGLAHHTNMIGLKGRFPESEFAPELRQIQAAKWAYRSVADGIDHFKAGRHTEAFQCLNKALAIDPCNIEGLVARGALYANSGSFKKAIEDFESALKVNPNHPNARKYLGETLVAYGRSFEEENNMEEALKAYEGCLVVIPYHEEAQNSIEYIKSKHMNGSMKVEGEVLPGLTPSKAQGVKDTLKQLLGNDEIIKEEGSVKKKKKEKKLRRKKRRSSSSSSSSTSGSSSSSSSSSSSDSSDSSHDSPHKKKHKRKSEVKDRSLSPLSKRMAMMDSTIEAEGSTNQRGSHYNPPSVPYTFTSAAPINYPPPSSAGSVKLDKESEYEQRVCKFLEQTKGDSDYEEKVRKFLDETAKWKKEKKAMEEKAKKKRKKEKKAKSKKKKHEDKQKRKMLKELDEKKLKEALRREKHRRRSNNVDEEEEFLYGDKPDLSLPDLEDLQSKLSAYYAKVEKGPTPKKKEKSSSIEKSASSSKTKSGSPKLHYLRDEEKEEQARLRKLEKKKLDMFAESPPRQESKLSPTTSSEPPVMSTKFKMQIGNTSSRLKKRDKLEVQKDTWDDDVGEKRFIYVNENENEDEPPPKEVVNEVKKTLEKKKENIGDSLAKVPTVMDKLGGFRINTMAVVEKKRPLSRSPKRKIRTRTGSDSSSSPSPTGRVVTKKRDKSPDNRHSRSRSHSRSRKKYSSTTPPPPQRKYSTDSHGSSYRKNRSRSKSGSYRSRSGRRYRSSESGSYRSRSYSRSRSRSNSMDYRRRSRSRSDDRHNYRNKYQGRYPRNRGTYYRPRFQNYKNPRGNGNYVNRGHRMGGRYIPRGRGGYIPRMRRGRARYFNNYRPRERDYRRYDRDMSRSDDDMDSPMRKVDLAKERIDKLLSEDKRHTGPLSEGEERDDDYIERKEYEGKWSKDGSPDGKDKKEDSKDRKSYSKPHPW